jgi:ATP-dependent DNA helicase RecG
MQSETGSTKKFLSSPLKTFYRLSPNDIENFAKLGIVNVLDILKYVPERYIGGDNVDNLQNAKIGEKINLYGVLKKLNVRRSWKSKIPMTEGVLDDGQNEVKVIWFSEAYIGKIYKDGDLVCLFGKLEEKSGKFFMANPRVEKIKEIPENKNNLFTQPKTFSDAAGVKSSPLKEEDVFGGVKEKLIPIYRETKGISSRLINEIVKRIITNENFKNIDDSDFLPDYIRNDLKLPSLREAILMAHFPTSDKIGEVAKKRFLFEEMFLLQIGIARERNLARGSIAYKIGGNISLAEQFFKLHNFIPTNAQIKVTTDILNDLRNNYPMQRLLEGDVGSGKTLVAATAAYATILSKRDQKKFGTPLQAAYLAPTEVLARQQFDSFIKFLSHTGIEIGYLSGKTALKFPSKSNPNEAVKVSRAQLIKWVKEGKISMLVGTHAITKKSVEFRDLALIIIDEQHRFGINARKDLAHKKGDKRPEIPHLLSMTATPIPRTLALAIFGDLDISIIDELPKGRKKIETQFVFSIKRKLIYEKIEQELKNGRQAYVICTKISNDEESNKKSVESEIIKLKKIFPEHKVASMHSKLKEEEKEKTFEEFKDNKIQILVSTSVVEVGVNVPNASVMIIEDADRFGLAQLHQLRGRVGRGEHQSYCYLFSETENDKALERLNNFSKTSSGFDLAEIDLRERGAGALLSTKQSGMSDMAMEALRNLKLVELSKKYAREIIDNDPDLENFIEIKDQLAKYENSHLE